MWSPSELAKSLQTHYSDPSNWGRFGLSTHSGQFCIKKWSMAKSKSSGKSSRQGKIPTDWAGQGLQLPKAMGKEFRELSGEFGHGGVKILGTAAVSLLLAMDKEDRDTLCAYVFQKTYRSAGDLEAKRVLELFKYLLLEQDGNSAPIVEPQWVVDREEHERPTSEPGKES